MDNAPPFIEAEFWEKVQFVKVRLLGTSVALMAPPFVVAEFWEIVQFVKV